MREEHAKIGRENGMKSEQSLSKDAQAELDRTLSLAAKAGEANNVAKLLAAGGNPQEEDLMGCNAFEWAARSESVETMEILAERCDINRRNINGWSPLAEAIIMGRGEETLRFLLSLSDLGMKHKVLGRDVEAGFQEFAKLSNNPMAAEEVAREELRRAAVAERRQIEEKLQEAGKEAPPTRKPSRI